MDTIRRLLAAAMILVAVIGLMPLITLVFGYQKADVTLDPTSTKYPAADTAPGTANRLIGCEQIPNSLNLVPNNGNRNQIYYIRCTNWWATTVNIQVDYVNDGGTGLAWSAHPITISVPPSRQICQQVGPSKNGNLTSNKNTGSKTIIYGVTLNPNDNASDLSGTMQFSGVFNFSGTVTTPTCSGF